MNTESIARELKKVLFSAAIGVEATGRKGQIIWEARGLVNDLIDALSSPPADDDVREALACAIADGQAHPLLPRPEGVAPFFRDYRAADHVLTVFEVSLRGEVRS